MRQRGSHPARKQVSLYAKGCTTFGKVSTGLLNTKQAIAIGLSKARRAGVRLGAPNPRTTLTETTKKAQQDSRKARAGGGRPSPRRSRATLGALKREPHRAASLENLSKQARTGRGGVVPGRGMSRRRKRSARRGQIDCVRLARRRRARGRGIVSRLRAVDLGERMQTWQDASPIANRVSAGWPRSRPTRRIRTKVCLPRMRPQLRGLWRREGFHRKGHGQG